MPDKDDKNLEQRIQIDQSTDNLDSVHIMPNEKKRVCIIGAGASGLVSIKVSLFRSFKIIELSIIIILILNNVLFD